ncbi:hypothetical protein [Ferrovum myxofaciens]|jgi:ABC-type branched-subunit amino acid transport system permease subunit|uniref:Uncharacterized protein n=2 Tax=root TaxID=1 RepID=A0A8F3IHL6_9PROT|nr:hypothetical protein [Ferrovum myxofaciens]KXW57434.1 hypothetical protein FEMY_20340 [Ferrovum myxofaciens]MBU6995732.1 hypothetical protein [Ferrovum myxofaciens]QKE39476.1 MAG: hypothetical protein HO273_12735 [Ferrovum myxofaciens]QWY74753.1 MAG: hypothetical protein JVY19_13310 [Ferrovum myxofaciens]QWY77499.1 MAG: hypothetical protein JZL65_13745 [Ferrovum myxofaciens]
MGTLLEYALIQVLHNFGALLVVGLSGYGFRVALLRHSPSQTFALFVLLAWLAQGLTGATFGWVTYRSDHRLPDIHGIAMIALMIKVSCVCGGAGLMTSCLGWGGAWSSSRRMLVWAGSTGLACLALTAAAFLRWFS